MSDVSRERVEAATVALIHKCRELKIAPGKVGSAGQWGLLAKAALVAAGVADLESRLALADAVVDAANDLMYRGGAANGWSKLQEAVAMYDRARVVLGDDEAPENSQKTSYSAGDDDAPDH